MEQEHGRCFTRFVFNPLTRVLTIGNSDLTFSTSAYRLTSVCIYTNMVSFCKEFMVLVYTKHTSKLKTSVPSKLKMAIGCKSLQIFSAFSAMEGVKCDVII